MAAKADFIPLENTPTPAEVASDHSLFALDFELDHLLEQIEDEIEENGQASDESMKRLEVFAKAINFKVDRIGSYLTAMETRVSHCKKEADRYAIRVQRSQNKIDRTKKMVLEYLHIHELKRMESDKFTLRSHKNSADSVIITQAETIPDDLRRFELKVDGPLWLELLQQVSEEIASKLKACVKSDQPSGSAIKAFVGGGGTVDGATVRREFHLRVE
jgi:Siphovirus Gp157